MSNMTNGWFLQKPKREQVELRMFCFPYAGGSAVLFNKWEKSLPPAVQPIPVELPGRGSRLQQAPHVSLPALLEELEAAILPLLEKPFVFFGHSMGAIIAFELARSLRNNHGLQARAIFVSGRRAPQVPKSEPDTYRLPQDEFIAELIKLEGTPKEVAGNSELMEFMIPLLRADFQLVQTYEYQPGAPLERPIAVFGGLQDHYVPQEKLLPWKDQTTSRCSLHMLPGDHFFLRSSQTQLLRLLTRELYEII
jgi:medium-chain acyl-[acyl-carrier-protein] hydrolase